MAAARVALTRKNARDTRAANHWRPNCSISMSSATRTKSATVPARAWSKAWLAQTNCPEIAIEVTEE